MPIIVPFFAQGMAACGEYREILIAFFSASWLLVRVRRHRSSLDHSNWMQRLALFSIVVFPDKGADASGVHQNGTCDLSEGMHPFSLKM
jgi:hypothetical protein